MNFAVFPGHKIMNFQQFRYFVLKAPLITLICGAAFVSIGWCQSLGTNLILNGNAEAGPAATAINQTVTSIPNWTGNASVIAYGTNGSLKIGDPSPPDGGGQFFIAVGTSSSTRRTTSLKQEVDFSALGSSIGAGNVRFTAAAYIGDNASYQIAVYGSAKVQYDFKNAAGTILTSVTLGPQPTTGRASGLFKQQIMGLVPASAVHATITLTMDQIELSSGAADSISLVLDTLGTDAATVLGPQLVQNGDAETSSAASPTSRVSYIAGWSTSNSASVAPYGGTGWVGTTDAGPIDRGVSLFHGDPVAIDPADMYQDIDLSAAASAIDAGNVSYLISAWLGALDAKTATPTLAYQFFDWTGKQLAATGQLGPLTHAAIGLQSSSHADSLPKGTRRVRVTVDFPASGSLADNISLTLSPAGVPVILPSGVVPVYSSSTTIQPGSWISIYGTNFATATTVWNGDFPTSLGGVSVTINSKPSYLWFVSPTQINLQAPDDTASGQVEVVVNSATGSAKSVVTLDHYGPSFSLFDSKYAAAIVQVSGAPGNSGAGYDYIGPTGKFVFQSRPVKAGETVLLYGVGFGPTTPSVPAGSLFSGAAPSVTLPEITIGGVAAKVSFAGIVQAGLFQFNVIVPAAGSGDKLLQATVGGLTTPANVFLTLQ